MMEENETESKSEIKILDHPVTNITAAELRVETFIVVHKTIKETNKVFVAQIKKVNSYVAKCRCNSAKRKGTK